ncbi:MAG: thermonuclease family protein [Planctomycetes bacterium]|nr:thermonuclease family protein [Planctomycetota bacterium]
MVRRQFPGGGGGIRTGILRRRFMTVLALLVCASIAVFMDRAGLFSRSRTAEQPDFPKYDGKTFRVANVVDGDTLDLDIPDGTSSHTRVRLWGVDTPETVRPDTPPMYFGREASQYAKQAALGKDVRVELEPGKNSRDKYSRLLAFIWLPDGRMLNRSLIEDGYGYADPRFPHSRKNEFEKLQQQACQAGRGLWGGAVYEQLPDYRDRLKVKLPVKKTQPPKPD